MALTWAKALGARLRFAVLFSAAAGYLADIGFNHGQPWFVFRALGVGLSAMAAFELMANWPAKLPTIIPRWGLQVVSVACAVPVATLAMWSWATLKGAPLFWRNNDRLLEFGFVTALGMLLAPWAALATLVRQKEAFARDQADAFALVRSELERRELEARLSLLRAQVAPHFLFNTLANLQALVDAGSPKAAALLRSLTIYLRAAVPRLEDSSPTLAQELTSVRAYLELMHMRMPDRLSFTVSADAGAEHAGCPPMAVLTLVENAVRHGIDPSQTGGRIDVQAHLRARQWVIEVKDTGVGMSAHASPSGTGLATLRERLRLTFGSQAMLHLYPLEPQGLCAELTLPAPSVAT